jgi:hypothetical protein
MAQEVKDMELQVSGLPASKAHAIVVETDFNCYRAMLAAITRAAIESDVEVKCLRHEFASQAQALEQLREEIDRNCLMAKIASAPRVAVVSNAEVTRRDQELASQAEASEQLRRRASSAQEAAEKEVTKLRGALEKARLAIDAFRRKLAAERAAKSQSHAAALALGES